MHIGLNYGSNIYNSKFWIHFSLMKWTWFWHKKWTLSFLFNLVEFDMKWIIFKINMGLSLICKKVIDVAFA
jgi:hypothetical protein